MTKGLIETNKGSIELEFFDEDAPNTVKNFVTLAEKGFYDGLTFHRVVPNFVIQGGDPTGTGAGNPGYAIPCETSGGNQKHINGALSMAHAGKDTGGSQFFIVLNWINCEHLNRQHTVFGKTIKGFEVVQNIEEGDKMLKVTVSDVSDKIRNMELKTLAGRR